MEAAGMMKRCFLARQPESQSFVEILLDYAVITSLRALKTATGRVRAT